MSSKSYIEFKKRYMARKLAREQSGTSFTHTYPDSEKERSLRGSQFTTSFERQMVAEKEYKEKQRIIALLNTQ